MTEFKNIKLSDEIYPKPYLNRSNEYSAKELSSRLLNNTYNGYNNSPEPLLILGLASLARYRDLFFKVSKGFAVGYLYGTTSAGKTNLLNTISSLYGFKDDFINSGDSTILSMWQSLGKYSRKPVIYDEISGKVINDSLFEGLIKSAYQRINRDKIAKVKTSIESTLLLSSNYQPTQRPEILNRLLLCNFEPENFKLENVIEFNDVREKYLSNLLPAIISFKSSQIIDSFNTARIVIKKLNCNLDTRSIDNIAIAYTGYKILLDIAEESQPDEVRQNFEKFVKFYDQSLKIESHWEEFLKSLPLLARNKKIIAEKDYKYAYDKEDMSIHLLCIHFEQAYNAFLGYRKQIKKDFPPSSKELLKYGKTDKNIISAKDQTTKPISINGVKKRCLVIDVRDNYELSHLDLM